MSDDIVTRLRQTFDIWLSHGEVDDLAWNEVAAEIERLREDRDKWRDIATELATETAIEYFSTPKNVLDSTWELIVRVGLTPFEKAVRDD